MAEGDGKADDGERRVGRTIAVSASRATVLLECQATAPLEMGNVVKMRTRAGTIYGMVSRLDIVNPGSKPSDQDLKTAEIEFAGEIGEANGAVAGFQRGTSAYPALDGAVRLATPEDLLEIYARPEAATARIGAIHQAASVPAYILTDELFGKHFSIVGTTGAGKSCLVAAILGAVIDSAPNAHLILLDPHSEYANAFGERAEVLSPGSGLYFPYWLFNFEELAEIVLGSEPQSDQAEEFWARRCSPPSSPTSPKPGSSAAAPSIRRPLTAWPTCCALSTRPWAA